MFWKGLMCDEGRCRQSVGGNTARGDTALHRATVRRCDEASAVAGCRDFLFCIRSASHLFLPGGVGDQGAVSASRVATGWGSFRSSPSLDPAVRRVVRRLIPPNGGICVKTPI